MEEEWHTFLQGWDLFKQGTDIPRAQISNQLWQCCHKDLEKDLFKEVTNVSDTDEHALLAAIKRLAVISTAASVRKTELLTMHQDHGQPIRSFAANVKGKAQVCAFAKECSNDNCSQIVDYTENIVKYVVISGIADEEIKKNVLGHADLDSKSLNNTISLIETKEMAARAMSIAGCNNDFNMAVHKKVNQKSSKDLDINLATKTNCKTCDKQMLKFTPRKGKIKEFSHCIDCWKAQRSNGQYLVL